MFAKVKIGKKVLETLKIIYEFNGFIVNYYLSRFAKSLFGALLAQPSELGEIFGS